MEITIKSFDFRLKRLNALEVLAFQTQISFDDLETVLKLYETILEKYEVKIGNGWLPVKTKGKNIFCPEGIENDVETVQSLINEFLKYLHSVFTKSDESNQ